MTKAQLAAEVADKTGIAKKDAESVVAATFEVIVDTLKKGDKIQLVGFGTFSTKDRPARTCINPATKQPVEVAATTVPVFKVGKAFKEAIAK
ncbi:MAG: HU family DNA-binding protein [Oscillospiraceae bacterium]